MAIASPVLERKVTASPEDAQQAQKAEYTSTTMSEEEIHNARIRDNYARLINPDYKISDLFNQQEATAQPEVKPLVDVNVNTANVARQARPYLVENARADAAIFRADSQINRRISDYIPESAKADEEEDNEDLRPTKTTIQYKTMLDSANKKKDIKINQKSEDHVLAKKEKIIIATFISVVVALFTLVIINSIVIANLNADIAAVEDKLVAVRGALANVSETINNSVIQFAQVNSWIKK